MKFRNDPMIRLYDKTQDWLQERGRPLVIGVGVLAGLVVIYMAGDYFLEYRASKAGVEFAKAYEKYSAQVVDTQTTTQVGRYYTDENQKWQESGEAFERLAQDQSSSAGSGDTTPGSPTCTSTKIRAFSSCRRPFRKGILR
jgi:hypothetical protein